MRNTQCVDSYSLRLLPPNRVGTTVVVFQAKLLQFVYVGKVTFDLETVAEQAVHE